MTTAVSSSERISIDVKDGVADVRLTRPDKRNALDNPMFEALTAAGAALREDSSVRAVVLSGEGQAFCAGLDFSSFMAMAGGGARSEASEESGSPARGFFRRGADDPANAVQHVAWLWTQLPMPVIAAVHGVAFGGGLQIALGADIRVVAPDARLSVMEIKWGLVPDMSGTQTLRHLVGLDVAKELTYTGRVVTGTEARELGLATRVSDTPLEAATELAREIATKSPHAIRAGKQLLNAAPLVSVEEGLLLEEQLQRGLLGSPNQIEAVKSNIEKRAANFSDPE